jgi:GntR family transcriptional regulator
MIPFRLTFRPGIPLYEQVLYAARKAIVSGQLRPGDPFPSVRTISRELRINPNTAHRVIADLTSQGLVEIKPGIGTVVAALPEASLAARTALLGGELEALVLEAKQLGLQFGDVVAALSDHWQHLGGAETTLAADPPGGLKTE